MTVSIVDALTDFTSNQGVRDDNSNVDKSENICEPHITPVIAPTLEDNVESVGMDVKSEELLGVADHLTGDVATSSTSSNVSHISKEFIPSTRSISVLPRICLEP